ncbi:MAG TPA: hypothetical protein VLT34_06485 [Arthrobacter sp.]|nr:hypothetical protein [Arthrobacter sp.]
MKERDLVAVAECVRDQWWRCDGEVLAQCCVSYAQQFKSEAAEPVHEAFG